MSDRQRIDAALVARLDLSTPRPEQSDLPFFDGTPLRPGQLELRWALELDTGSESIPVVLKKFVCYRDHHRDGTYAQIFKGPVLLVLLVQNERRAGLLATEFRRAWSEGWGVVSLPKVGGADHPTHGALWGTYRRLLDSQPVSLLTPVGVPSDKAQPLLSLAQWEAYLAMVQAGTHRKMPPTVSRQEP